MLFEFLLNFAELQISFLIVDDKTLFCCLISIFVKAVLCSFKLHLRFFVCQIKSPVIPKL